MIAELHDVPAGQIQVGDYVIDGDAVQRGYPDIWVRVIAIGPCPTEDDSWVQITTTALSYGIERDVMFRRVLRENPDAAA